MELLHCKKHTPKCGGDHLLFPLRAIRGNNLGVRNPTVCAGDTSFFPQKRMKESERSMYYPEKINLFQKFRSGEHFFLDEMDESFKRKKKIIYT